MIASMLIPRRLQQTVEECLADLPAVAILGPRQVGKTTLARAIAAQRPSVYLDLERPSDLAKLADPELYLAAHAHELVVIDEVHRAPSLFRTLRGVIDEGRRQGKGTGRFLLLGSASMDLMRQSGESLAGRLAYVELGPFDVLEFPEQELLWLRGGFPESVLARSDTASLRWRESFIRTYLERDIPQLGPRIPAETLRRFWTMLAHCQAGLLNAAALARGLAVDGKTIAGYLDLMVDLLLVRRLPPHHANVRKRLVKSPKVYVRDSGLVHALLGLPDGDALLGHPIVGASFEGFVIETLLGCVSDRAQASFYRTSAGAEIDLVLTMPGGERWAIEVKRGLSPKLDKGFHLAREDLKPARSFVAYSGSERFALSEGVEAVGVRELAALVQAALPTTPRS
jgi:uncharacterized protein